MGGHLYSHLPEIRNGTGGSRCVRCGRRHCGKKRSAGIDITSEGQSEKAAHGEYPFIIENEVEGSSPYTYGAELSGAGVAASPLMCAPWPFTDVDDDAMRTCDAFGGRQ
jgi:hypothetical protein